jgi:hypothetical protein
MILMPNPSLFPQLSAGLLALVLVLHIYWAAGGRLLLPQTVPSRPDTQKPAAEPGRLGAGLVALALAHALFTLGAASGLWSAPWSADATRYSAYVWTGLFVLRVVGDFRGLGLFKRVRGTPFARADDWVFTPICATVGIAFVLVLSES